MLFPLGSEQRQPFLISLHFISSRECLKALKESRTPFLYPSSVNISAPCCQRRKKNPHLLLKNQKTRLWRIKGSFVPGATVERGDGGPSRAKPHPTPAPVRLESQPDGSGEQAGPKPGSTVDPALSTEMGLSSQAGPRLPARAGVLGSATRGRTCLTGAPRTVSLPLILW